MMLRRVLLLIGFVAPIALAGTGDSRIIGGTLASTGEYPSQLSLQLNGVHRCGASVISGFWAITTAYCIDVNGTTKENFTVLSGTNSLTEGGTRHTVTNVIPHEFYNPNNSWQNDIAVLRVEVPFEIEGILVNAITIPDQNFDVIETTPVTVVGWGSHEEGGSIASNLYEAELEIANLGTCQTRYAEMEETVTDKQICAASTVAKRGSCSGDTGGPLIWIREDDPIPEPNLLVGLVSWGLGCARPGYPTVYTRVASYCAWIRFSTGDDRLCNIR